jgi:hypothetical protein
MKNGNICYVIGKYTQLVFSQGFPASCSHQPVNFPISVTPYLSLCLHDVTVSARYPLPSVDGLYNFQRNDIDNTAVLN